MAYIVLSDILSGGEYNPASIEARCREKLASFKVPRRFEVVEKLPRNALGKVQKHLLCPRILMVASEAAPFAKDGRLGRCDGLAAARRWSRLGDEVAVVLPRYRHIEIDPARSRMAKSAGPGGAAFVSASRSTQLIRQGVRYFFVDCPPLYDRAGIYNDAGVDYPDNHIRFAALSQAAIGVARHLFRPDVFHAHDWQAGLLPVYLRENLRWRSDVLRRPLRSHHPQSGLSGKLSRPPRLRIWDWTGRCFISGD